MQQQNIGKLLPIEGFYVIFRGEISTTYFQALTHLYQPLIGIHAIALYQTLLSESFIRHNPTTPNTHHTLMNYMSLPLDEIYQARLKLEAIGLLTTFKEQSDQITYTYYLNPPFSYNDFFDDGMLSQLLYHHLGEDKYTSLLKALSSSEMTVSNSANNVTASFNDVFQTHSTMFNKMNSNEKSNDQKNEQSNKGPTVSEDMLDFEWIEQMLSQRMLPATKVLSPRNKKLMSQMVVLYDLTNQDLEKAILWAVNEENLLEVQEFKTACHDLMKSPKKKSDIKLVNKRDGVNTSQSNLNKSLSKEEQFIQMLETISPKQLLEDLAGGNEASSQDLKIIGDVMSQQGLKPGVINVLIHYVLLKTDMKLTKAYLEKIASHWARKNVTTVKQAMTLAKSEHKKYQEWGSNKQQFYKKTTKKEVVPDWFTESKSNDGNQKKKKSNDDSQDNEDISKLLQNYTKNKKSNHL
ncbi:replication initiation and membrane attachment family protein [Aquibacillus saliphilus]|uniref:replication initiation and membrane attachment family protein n=1 Tax=Aquibacillus saliphilus TaxID=1909422 RepID=UPI001CF01009|nr:DnaD domain protein [Aquibacillus saliphilus]